MAGGIERMRAAHWKAMVLFCASVFLQAPLAAAQGQVARQQSNHGQLTQGPTVQIQPDTDLNPEDATAQLHSSDALVHAEEYLGVAANPHAARAGGDMMARGGARRHAAVAARCCIVRVRTRSMPTTDAKRHRRRPDPIASSAMARCWILPPRWIAAYPWGRRAWFACWRTCTRIMGDCRGRNCLRRPFGSPPKVLPYRLVCMRWCRVQRA